MVGGGVQVATAFIRQALQRPHAHKWMFAVSPPVMWNLESLSGKQLEEVVEISPSPARIRRGMRSRRRLRQLEEQFRPDVVFTVFGPAYHRFRAPHVCGFADPWVTHRSKLAMNSLPRLQRCCTYLKCLYKQARLSRKDAYWVEVPVAQRGLARILGIPESRVKVIPNTFSDVFSKAPTTAVANENPGRPTRVFTLAHPYPHKNLTIIPKVADILRRTDQARNYRFTVTLPDTGREVKKFRRLAKDLGAEPMIENAGRLKLEECPEWYAKSNIVFLPTLLETFSATYPEAMQMGKPIVTTDLDFAHDVCGDAAIYYSPLSAKAAAGAIMKVASNAALRADLVARGRDQLKRYPSPEEKYQMQLEWIETVALHNVDG